jgi:hypothetical protein
VCVVEAESEKCVVEVDGDFRGFGFLFCKGAADGEVTGDGDADEFLPCRWEVTGLTGAALQAKPDGAFAAAFASGVFAAADQALGVFVALQAAAEVVVAFTGLETEDVFAFSGIVLLFRVVVIVATV